MKNSYSYIVYLFSALLLLSGCELEEDYLPPNYATFGVQEMDVTVNEGSSHTFEVTLYTANTTNSDRTFTISVDEESSLNSEAFDLPSEVVIPANSNEATISIEIEDNNLSSTGGTLILSLDHEEGLLTGEPLKINVHKFCSVNIEDYVGTFTGTGSWSENYGYTTEVETFYNENGDLMINGLVFQWFQDWWGEEIVRNEAVKVEIDEATGIITIPEQFYIESTYNGEPQPVYNIKATGRINACEKEISINPVIIQDGTEITGTNWSGELPFLETIRLETDSENTGGVEN